MHSLHGNNAWAGYVLVVNFYDFGGVKMNYTASEKLRIYKDITDNNGPPEDHGISREEYRIWRFAIKRFGFSRDTLSVIKLNLAYRYMVQEKMI